MFEEYLNYILPYPVPPHPQVISPTMQFNPHTHPLLTDSEEDELCSDEYPNQDEEREFNNFSNKCDGTKVQVEYITFL